jgi:hypothetical protein
MSARRPTTRGALVLMAALSLLGYYAWTASSSGDPFNKLTPYQSKYGDSDFYNLLAAGFLKGQLSLDAPVPPELMAAANPYDPRVPGQRLPDASLYNDRWYLTWGPAPALTTFVPFQLMGTQLRENLAIVIYAFIGVLAACASLALLVRRLVPGTRSVVIWSGWASIALAGVLPFMLRRPTIYEVALTGAFCFSMTGLYLLLRETVRPQPPRMRRLALVGVLFGLAVLTRPTFLFVTLAMAGLAPLLRHDGRLPRGLTSARRRALALVVGIPALAGVIFMVYNALRFSGPLDFGNKYQMGGRDVRFLTYNSLGNLKPALFGYLVAPLRLGLEFPYVHLPPPPAGPIALPLGFGAEPTGSIFWAVPMLLVTFVALGRGAVSRIRGRCALSPLVTRVVLALVAIAAIPLLSGAYAIPGHTERYELDFLPCLMIAATLAWAELVRVATTPRRAAIWRRVGVLLTTYGVVVGVAIGFSGYNNGLKSDNRKVFVWLERLFSPLPTAVAMLAGHPMIPAATAPAGVVSEGVGYVTLDLKRAAVILAPDAPAQLTVVSPDRRKAQIRFVVDTNLAESFVVTAAVHGRASTRTVRKGMAVAVPVELRRGVNYIDLTGVPVDWSAAQQPLVALAELRVE